MDNRPKNLLNCLHTVCPPARPGLSTSPQTRLRASCSSGSRTGGRPSPSRTPPTGRRASASVNPTAYASSTPMQRELCRSPNFCYQDKVLWYSASFRQINSWSEQRGTRRRKEAQAIAFVQNYVLKCLLVSNWLNKLDLTQDRLKHFSDWGLRASNDCFSFQIWCSQFPGMTIPIAMWQISDIILWLCWLGLKLVPISAV